LINEIEARKKTNSSGCGKSERISISFLIINAPQAAPIEKALIINKTNAFDRSLLNKIGKILETKAYGMSKKCSLDSTQHQTLFASFDTCTVSDIIS